MITYILCFQVYHPNYHITEKSSTEVNETDQTSTYFIFSISIIYHTFLDVNYKINNY